ncbi:hypothetical protein Acr_00g0067820 [Actinidia rufa]|uniref:Uncharacterized protein n=1 Tax=Actinidia rufa TaxID=165716 RepID=A0A7J0DRY0_9ERIC|nr:hypothetical protein Acr_00g0067820 [Actinidia rufa]
MVSGYLVIGKHCTITDDCRGEFCDTGCLFRGCIKGKCRCECGDRIIKGRSCKTNDGCRGEFCDTNCFALGCIKGYCECSCGAPPGPN